MRRDSPVEWTGEAHLVSTSCAECGGGVSVAEDVAANGIVTCEGCEHDCLDHLVERGADPALPPHVVPYECDVCGQWYEFDVETGEHSVDC